MKQLKLTKDESRLLVSLINSCKYYYEFEQTDRHKLTELLQAVGCKLENYSKDARRLGRTSQDDFSDLLKRLYKSYNL